MLDTSAKPHPFVTTNVLYVLYTPPRVKWEHLVATFSPCGKITSMGAIKTAERTRTWTIRLQDIFHAELALAMLQGRPVKGLAEAVPPHCLQLSYMSSPIQPAEISRGQCFPQYVKGIESSILRNMRAETIFTIFRRAGPLISIRFDAAIGEDTLACSVQYFNVKDAHLATTLAIPVISEKLRAAKQSLSLQAYDPCTLIYTGITMMMSLTDARRIFSQYGNVAQIYVTREDTRSTVYNVTYSTEAQASRAKELINMLRSEHPQATFSHAESNREGSHEIPRHAPDAECSPGGTRYSFDSKHFRSSKDTQDIRSSRQKALHEAQNKLTEAKEADNKAQEEDRAAEIAAYEATTRHFTAIDKHEQKLAELLAANVALKDARVELEKAQKKEVVLQRDSARLEREHNAAENVLLEAKKQENAALSAYGQARAVKQKTVQRLAEALSEERVAREAYDSVRPAPQDNDVHDDKLNESIRRMAELRAEESRARSHDRPKQTTTKSSAEILEDSLKRMADLRAEEQRLSEERIRRTREAREAEKRRREADEAARIEARKAQERVRYEQERKKVIEEARSREQQRCRQRDQSMCGLFRGWWSSEKALKRFQLVSEEFDNMTFNDTQPLSFGNIPWPLLSDPLHWTVADVEWRAIDRFFKEVQAMSSNAEYKTLVEQCHRRFHPDKWKARRILATAREDEKQALETAGNIVAQALTPLWRATKV